MSEQTQVAMSYAKAVYELCDSAGQTKTWSETLNNLAQVAEHAEMSAFLGDDSRPKEARANGFLKVVGDSLEGQALNLVKLLGEKDRLSLLPEIAKQFDELVANVEKRIVAYVTSAQPLTSEQSNQIKSALGKRLDRTVEIEATVDESLIGGAIIRAGDLVIDGSMRGELEQLAVHMSR
ncbi:MAG TPA: F0F1 ATP synthase subunit delta [Halothiobacillaceae bacterium]|nr:F0F1 ATP synthase subunit delta [Halothiobacillaceae bacterium]